MMDEPEIKKYVHEIVEKKEYGWFSGISSAPDKDKVKKILGTFINSKNKIILPGLQMHGSQLFVRNFMNVNTLYKRILIMWKTGVGKTIGMISIIEKFASFYRNINKQVPNVYVIAGPENQEEIQKQLLQFPDFGFVSYEELEDLGQLKLVNFQAYINKLGLYKKRLTNRKKGGYYQFFGYKEFAYKLFGKVDFSEITDIESLKKLNITINQEILDELKNSLLIVDEIQNVYNMREKNTYGIAVQYVLNELGKDAPRTVVMSATPMTGSVVEIVNILNLLSEKQYTKTEFFDNIDDPKNIKFKPNTMDKLRSLFVGKVSYAFDSNYDSYPERVFIGTPIKDIEYLNFCESKMSKFHRNTFEYLLSKSGSEVKTIGNSDHSAYDMTFPNPESETIGLNNSNELYMKIKNASPEWRDNNGINVLKLGDEGDVATGPFLKLPTLEKYSAKYSDIMKEILKIIKTENSGKIMIYHHYVRISGVMLIAEMLKMNGLIDYTSNPINNTLCSICGSPLQSHNSSIDHIFIPCRYMLIYHEIPHYERSRMIDDFNSMQNFNGNKIKILIGSRILRESVTIKAVQHQFIASMIPDIPTLLQVIGRVVRKGSHYGLEKASRKVSIYISVYDIENDVKRFREKMKSYILIQKVEKELKKWAIDYNLFGMPITEATINSLPFEPGIKITETKLDTTTFEAYEYFEDEKNIIHKISEKIFENRKIWTYKDLLEAIRTRGVISNIHVNVSSFDEGNVAIILQKFIKHGYEHNGQIYKLNFIDPYYIVSIKDLDVETFQRDVEPGLGININFANILNSNLISYGFDEKYKTFKEKYCSPKSNIILFLTEFNESFHYYMLKKMCEHEREKLKNSFECILRAKQLYNKFKILIHVSDILETEEGKIIVSEKYKKDNIDTTIGYCAKNFIMLYFDNYWQKFPKTIILSKKRIENNIVVGSMDNGQFKIRHPIHKLNRESVKDIRDLKKMATCTTRSREFLEDIIYKFKLVSEDKIKNISIPILCDLIRDKLLHNELLSRIGENNEKWFYLFNDKLPVISL
jgi:hypothetical protein